MKKAVCVCSGGIDSTVAATIASKEDYELYLFHASYGQRAEEKEKEAVKKIALYLGAKEIKYADIPFLRILGSSSLTDKSKEIRLGADLLEDTTEETPPTWVPCRNLLLLAHASAYAEVIGAEAIFVGFNAEEAKSYPDNSKEFVERFNATLKKAIASFSRPPLIKAPLVDLLKPDIIRLGVEIKAPLHLTYSCYLGGDNHCGLCESCLRRKRGFKEAGVEDITKYENP
ncbi:MAG: 7-cyano-7-deazaguanine synthase QueC [Candidatus Methanospirareceae archaeon]